MPNPPPREEDLEKTHIETFSEHVFKVCGMFLEVLGGFGDMLRIFLNRFWRHFWNIFGRLWEYFFEVFGRLWRCFFEVS